MTTPPDAAAATATATAAPAPAVVIDDDDDDCGVRDLRSCKRRDGRNDGVKSSKQLLAEAVPSPALPPPSSFPSPADANANANANANAGVGGATRQSDDGRGKLAVDFIGPSSAVKHLFSLPYNSDRSVSVACHNMGNGTLLLDSWEDDYFGVVATTAASPPSGPFGGGGGIGVGVDRRGSSAGRSMRGRRRQRPSSWSIRQQHDDDDNDERQRRALSLYEYAIGDDDDDHDANVESFELNQTQQTAMLRENERSLLASLSLLLEEEEGGGGKKKGEMAQGKEQRQLPSTSLTSPSNAIIVSGKKSNDVGGTSRAKISLTMEKSTEPDIVGGGVPIVNNKPENVIVMGQEESSNDPLLETTLHPPQEYLSHYAGVALPTPPRQYVNWKFRDMKLLIGSDAIIYDRGGVDGGGGGGGTEGGTGINLGEEIDSSLEGAGERVLRRRSLDDVDDEEGRTAASTRSMTSATGPSSTIAILIADASELKSQMIDNMVKNKMEDDRRLSVEEEGGINGRRALPPPPSSYAEALLMTPPSSSTLTEVVEAEVEGGDDNAEVNNVAKLQTCIIPTSVVGPEWANEWASRLGFARSPLPSPPTSGVRGGAEKEECFAATTASSSGVRTVLDAYLDNIMANVPQLALILREHGYVQNIKLMRTEDIPSLMMHPSTLGSFEMNAESSSTAAAMRATAAHHHPLPPQVFSPDIVEMNAAMLLQFLKTNCTSENSTFVVHRAAGETNIQLFDISSISKMRQRKWTWWLALCGYRFACRLEQLVKTTNNVLDGKTRREYRNRQRSLLQNTLDLLEELVDLDDDDDRNAQRRRHDTIGAAVCEHLADTYLWNRNDVDDHNESDQRVVDSISSKSPEPYASCQVRYGRVTVDSLNKAHDHLMTGVKKLTPLLSKARQEKSSIEIEAISTQLYGLHHKLINVNLRLADRHLQNYFASNLIQSLRTSARILSETIPLLGGMVQGSRSKNKSSTRNDQSNMKESSFDIYARSILLQYAWLWEYCGHFARSFAADGLWRDRGHTCGQDLIGLFREVNNFCSCIRKQFFGAAATLSVVSVASHGQVSLKNTLSGIVVLPKDFEQIETSVLQKEGCHEAIGAAKFILDQKTEIKRDARLVLVAASICYGHAIDAYVFLASHSSDGKGGVDCDEKSINLISMASNVVTTVAPLLRQRLGDACNEIGKVLLQESRDVLSPQLKPPGKIFGISNNSFDMSHVSAIMLISAQFWFLEGLKQFTDSKDLRNLALLRCNLCQCCKIRANTNVVLPEEEDSSRNNSESYLQEAVDHLVLAHEAIGQRDADPITWDMVSEELAATLLVLGVRRRQSTLSSSSEPLLFQALRLTPGAEKAILEPMERSCQIYESLGTPRASHQAAAAHYQLALYFSKVWTCQRDEAKTREKLAAAFKHYGLAHQYFAQYTEGNEATFVVLSLDFSNLYSAVSGEECLSKALLCCLDTRMAFSLPVAPAVTKQMTTLADSVESRVSKLLLSLVKLQPSDKYKDMYRTVLAHKMLASANANSQSGGESNQLFVLLNSLFELYKA